MTSEQAIPSRQPDPTADFTDLELLFLILFAAGELKKLCGEEQAS